MTGSIDDTFKALKRATFDDVRRRLGNQTNEEMLKGKWIEILESMGWTDQEYSDRLKILFDEVINDSRR